MQAACDGQCAVVGSIERKRVEKKPPKLYDLTTLQREANRYYGLPASQTLQAAQELYEEKLVTYPRTDSQFVTEEMCIRDRCWRTFTPLAHWPMN